MDEKEKKTYVDALMEVVDHGLTNSKRYDAVIQELQKLLIPDKNSDTTAHNHIYLLGALTRLKKIDPKKYDDSVRKIENGLSDSQKQIFSNIKKQIK